MYEVSEEFLSALEADECLHHIRAEITEVSGAVIQLQEELRDENIRIERQCTSSEQTFNFGEMYVGTVELTVNMEGVREYDLKGGEIALDFGVDVTGGIEWIPLGRWTITEPKRNVGGALTIKGMDCLSKLSVPISDTFVGSIGLEARMAKVTELTGAEFAQTPQEIAAMTTVNGLRGSSYCSSCWAEVQAIAQIVGGFAFANRENKIEFRQFGTSPALTIPARRRFSAQLSEYEFSIRGVGYEDKYGHQTFVQWETSRAETSSLLLILENPYIWDIWYERSADIDDQYRYWLAPIADNLKNVPKWTPGTIDYYGNPALDIGDIVRVEGGINGDKPADFLICADYWQFRGPQTLIAGGVSETGGGTTGGGGSASSAIATVNVTKSLVTVDIPDYPGALSGRWTTIASGGFSCRNATNAFITAIVTLRGTETSEVRLQAMVDGVAQTIGAAVTLHAGECATLHIQVPIACALGSHTIAVRAAGSASAEAVSVYIWGQDIAEESGEITTDSDYIWHIENGGAVIDEYIGSSLAPVIPASLGGVPVKVIGGSSFTDSEIEFVSIPEGVEEIE